MNRSNILTAGGIEVDLTILNELTDNDPVFTRVMVDTFISNSNELVKRMQDANDNEDWEEVYKAAHRAKSSLSVFKINGLTELAFELEQAGKHRTNLEKIPGMVREFNSVLSKAVIILFSHFNDQAID